MYNKSTTMDKSLAIKIRRARKETKMSQKELGEALGISDKAISSYEQARAVPPIKTLQKIAKITHKPLGYFTATEDSEVDYSVSAILANVEKELKEIKDLLTNK